MFFLDTFDNNIVRDLVGNPIEVSKVDNPSEEFLLNLQGRYIAELRRLWDEYKDMFATDRVGDLEIVG